MYDELSKHYSRTSDAIHYDRFESKGTRLYITVRKEPLTNRFGNSKKDTEFEKILAKNRLFELGFDATDWPKAKKAEELKKAQTELHSELDIANAVDIKLQENGKNALRIIENLNQQLENPI